MPAGEYRFCRHPGLLIQADSTVYSVMHMPVSMHSTAYNADTQLVATQTFFHAPNSAFSRSNMPCLRLRQEQPCEHDACAEHMHCVLFDTATAWSTIRRIHTYHAAFSCSAHVLGQAAVKYNISTCFQSVQMHNSGHHHNYPCTNAQPRRTSTAHLLLTCWLRCSPSGARSSDQPLALWWACSQRW
jgi:hypothetical protein